MGIEIDWGWLGRFIPNRAEPKNDKELIKSRFKKSNSPAQSSSFSSTSILINLFVGFIVIAVGTYLISQVFTSVNVALNQTNIGGNYTGLHIAGSSTSYKATWGEMILNLIPTAFAIFIIGSIILIIWRSFSHVGLTEGF